MLIITENHSSQDWIWNHSNSLNFIKNTKNQNPSSFFNFASICKILVALILYNHILHLFVLSIIQNRANCNCRSKHHPWLLEFSSARGYLKSKQSSYSPSTSSCCFCFKESSSKNINTSLPFPGWWRIELHDLLQVHMRFIDRAL